MATTLGLVGSEVPVWSQGRDFSPLLRGEDFNPPADVLLELLRETRDPYSDVLIEHGVTCDDPVADVSPHPARHLPYLHE